MNKSEELLDTIKSEEFDKSTAKKIKSVIDDVAEAITGKSAKISVDELSDYDSDDLTALYNTLRDASDKISKLGRL